ncbi:MAG TPA: hypothetical protein V6C46_03100 [Coleofasciculaceae cyanobacterium]
MAFHSMHHRHSYLTQVFSWAGIVILLLGSTGCATVTPISQLQRRSPDTVIASDSPNPLGLPFWPRFHATVQLKGKVGRSVPLVEGSVYQLSDGTGEIWVVTRKKAPPVGSTVQINGKLRYQPFASGMPQQGAMFIEQGY